MRLSDGEKQRVGKAVPDKTGQAGSAAGGAFVPLEPGAAGAAASLTNGLWVPCRCACPCCRLHRALPSRPPKLPPAPSQPSPRPPQSASDAPSQAEPPKGSEENGTIIAASSQRAPSAQTQSLQTRNEREGSSASVRPSVGELQTVTLTPGGRRRITPAVLTRFLRGDLDGADCAETLAKPIERAVEASESAVEGEEDSLLSEAPLAERDFDETAAAKRQLSYVTPPSDRDVAECVDLSSSSASGSSGVPAGEDKDTDNDATILCAAAPLFPPPPSPFFLSRLVMHVLDFSPATRAATLAFALEKAAALKQSPLSPKTLRAASEPTEKSKGAPSASGNVSSVGKGAAREASGRSSEGAGKKGAAQNGGGGDEDKPPDERKRLCGSEGPAASFEKGTQPQPQQRGQQQPASSDGEGGSGSSDSDGASSSSEESSEAEEENTGVSGEPDGRRRLGFEAFLSSSEPWKEWNPFRTRAEKIAALERECCALSFDGSDASSSAESEESETEEEEEAEDDSSAAARGGREHRSGREDRTDRRARFSSPEKSGESPQAKVGKAPSGSRGASPLSKAKFHRRRRQPDDGEEENAKGGSEAAEEQPTSPRSKRRRAERRQVSEAREEREKKEANGDSSEKQFSLRRFSGGPCCVFPSIPLRPSLSVQVSLNGKLISKP